MDIAGLYQLFSASYHADTAVRKQAEDQITLIESQENFMSLLLQLILAHETDPSVKQAASIYFKNRVRKAWSPSSERTPISEQDKIAIKQNIIPVIISSSSQVRNQLSPCCGVILSNDLISNWPEFIPVVTKFLQDSDINNVLGGLVVFRELIKAFQWKSGEKRQDLNTVIKHTFPGFLALGNGFISSNDMAAAECIKVILKCYFGTIQFELSAHQRERESLVGWATFMLSLIEKPIPLESLPEDKEERDSYPWIVAKKWSFHCLNKLFSRYGNPTYDNLGKKYRIFAKEFAKNFAPNILNCFLKQTEQLVSGTCYLSPKILQHLSNFYLECVSIKNTWNLLKPHVNSLISHFIFPQLCFTDEDQELWESDPVEYIHKKVDPLEDYRNPVVAASSFVVELVSKRKKETLMDILAFLNNVLKRYSDAPVDAKSVREKDGALYLISCLAEILSSKHSGVNHEMEQFIVAHVFPEFKSPSPILRGKACETLRSFVDLELQHDENIIYAFEAVFECLKDSELPVKVQAALTMKSLIAYDLVREKIGPNLPFIMQELMNLTNQLDLDTLSSVMEDFVEIFAPQLSPFAVELCEQLRDAYLRIATELAAIQEKSAETDEYDDSDKAFAAMGVLKTIGTLLISLESSAEILHKLETVLLPVITFTLEHGLIELYDEVFGIIDTCTYASKSVSPAIWSCFDLIHKAFKDSGIDFLEEMLPSLDNYISYGKDVFIANEHAQHVILDIIQTTMTADTIGDMERISGFKLMESMMINCRGHMDKYIPSFLDLAFEFLQRDCEEMTNSFLVHLIEVVVNAIYYNPTLSLAYLEERNCTSPFFTLWFKSLDKFTRVHDKKLCMMALMGMMEVPFESLPVSLKGGWSQMMTALLSVFKSYPEALKNREDMEKMYEYSSGEEDEDEDAEEYVEKEYNDDPGLDHDHDHAHDNDDNDDDFDNQEIDDLISRDEELQEEVLFETPLDNINPYSHFHLLLQAIQQNQPSSYQLLVQSLDEDQKHFIMSLMEIAEQKKLEEMKQLQQNGHPVQA